MSNSPPDVVRLVAVALVPVLDCPGDVGVLLVARDEGRGEVVLPQVCVKVDDASWEDALVRGAREQTGLPVAFDAHVMTVSSAGGELLIFGQTSAVREAEVRDSGRPGVVTVVRDGDPDIAPACAVHRRVIAHWLVDRAGRRAGSSARDRRCGLTGRRAADADALAATNLAGAVRAVHELVSQNADFSADQYACRLLAGTLDALLADQRARWAEHGAELLLTFLWEVPRERLPVDDLFAAAAEWTRAEAQSDPSACFAQPAVDRVRAWMDDVALAHGLGRVMAPVHAADPVGVVRSLLGFGRFGRLDARLLGDTEAVLTQLDETQWELVYVALGARRPRALTPTRLDPDELLDDLADVLARAHRLAAR